MLRVRPGYRHAHRGRHRAHRRASGLRKPRGVGGRRGQSHARQAQGRVAQQRRRGARVRARLPLTTRWSRCEVVACAPADDRRPDPVAIRWSSPRRGAIGRRDTSMNLSNRSPFLVQVASKPQRRRQRFPDHPSAIGIPVIFWIASSNRTVSGASGKFASSFCRATLLAARRNCAASRESGSRTGRRLLAGFSTQWCQRWRPAREMEANVRL